MPKSTRRYCSIYNCQVRGGVMFRFPQNNDRREQWKAACHISKPITDTMNICIRHFQESDVYKTPKGLTRVVKGARPSINLPTSGPPPRKNRRCVVLGCEKNLRDGVTMHFFPRLVERQLEWQNLCKLSKSSRHTLICSNHFLEEDFYFVGNRKVLKSKATPSLHLDFPVFPPYSAEDVKAETLTVVNFMYPTINSDIPPLVPIQSSAGGDIESHIKVESSSVLCIMTDNFAVQCSEVENVDAMLKTSVDDSECSKSDGLSEGNKTLLHCDVLSDSSDGWENGENSDYVQNVPSTFEKGSMGHQSTSSLHIQAACDVSDSSHVSVKNNLATQTDRQPLNLFNLIHDDSQLKAFTGVTFGILNRLTNLVVELATDNGKSELGIKERIVLTLCKLRLNLSYECIGVFFGITRRLCRYYFSSMVHLLALVLQGFVYWPCKEEIELNMPKCFFNYRDTRVILDCTEIPVVSPNCLKSRLRLYSHYKGAHTVKVLIGLAPSGLITFVGKVYSGKASDKQIFEESDLRTKHLLEPFVDAVMVDKGFRIDSSCEEINLKIHRPPFTGSKQCDIVTQNAQIANAGVHVEQALQRIKIFKILHSRLSLSIIPLMDDIMTVIAGIVNIGPPILF